VFPQIIKASNPSHFSALIPLFLEYEQFFVQLDCMECGGNDIRREIEDFNAAYPPDSGGIWIALSSRHPERSEGSMEAGPKGDLSPLAQDDEIKLLGCIALQKLVTAAIPESAQACEARRLYVRSDARGLRLGRKLMEHLIAEARKLGYKRLYLDTFRAAPWGQAIYRELGFREIPPYNSYSPEKALFMEYDL